MAGWLVEVDIGIFVGVTPPCLVPLSTRAKEFLGLPEGVEGIIALAGPNETLSSFPKDYVFASISVAPKVVAITTIERMH